jgi:predicted O-methyltransferase YrrM
MITKKALDNEPLVTIVRIRQNGIRDDKDTFFAHSVKRLRYKNIEWQRMFEIALPPGFGRDTFMQEMAEAIYQAKSEYVCLGIDHFQFDEAWISTAVGFLEAAENRDVDGVLAGAWICDSNGKAVDELFCKNKKYNLFASLRHVLPDSQNPVSLLGLLLCRKPTWEKLITQLSQRDLPLKGMPESIFNMIIGEDANLKIHKLQIPLMVIHTPQSGKELSEKGVACGAKGQWQKAATFFQRAMDTGYQDPELDFWKIACLARLGKKHEAGIMSFELLAEKKIINQRQLDVLNNLASQAHPDHLKFIDIEQSVKGIEGRFVEGREKYLFNKVKSLPDGALIVEIGSGCGRSTAAMAYACWGTRKKIIAIDTFLGNTDSGSRIKRNSFFDVWERNIRQRGLMNYVTAMPGYSHEQLGGWDRKRLIDFVFINASHLYEDIVKELSLVYPYVKPGGWIALHDVDPAWPGPWRVWRESGVTTLSSHEYVSTLACGQKQSGAALYIPEDTKRYDCGESSVKPLRPMASQQDNIQQVSSRKSDNSGGSTIVFVNTYYPQFLQSHYALYHELAKAPYDEQIKSLNSQRFGDSDFYSTGMRKAGWHAVDLIVNCNPLQSAWATENGYAGQGLEIAVEQIRRLKPDVVYLQDLCLATKEFLSRIRGYTRLIAGQIASPLPPNADINGIDIIFSSFPHFVERFRAAGITSYYQPLAFDPGVLDTLAIKDKIHDVTFIGGVSPAHGKGLKLLEAVAEMVPMDFWGYGAEQLPVDSIIRKRHHGETWGLDMFNTMAQSRITINRHIDVAENYANNMRLFEATGCGALLITDYKDNLNDLFEIGSEVVAYRSSEECAALVKYYLQHPEEAAAIARNGQKKNVGRACLYLKNAKSRGNPLPSFAISARYIHRTEYE